MNAAPGWYPDNAGAVRYWDGAQWTAHTQPQAQAHAPQSPAQAYAQPQPVYAEPEIALQQTASTELHVAPQLAPHAQPIQPQYQAQNSAVSQTYQPQTYQPQPYQPQIVGTGESNGVATAGFVVGIVSVFLPIFFGLAAGITGLVLSIVGANRSSSTGTGKGLAIAGIVLSSVGIIFIL